MKQELAARRELAIKTGVTQIIRSEKSNMRYVITPDGEIKVDFNRDVLEQLADSFESKLNEREC